MADISQKGALARGIDWLLGAQWHQKVTSVCGYIQWLCGIVAGGTLLSAGQVDNLGVPWLARHWLAIMGWATIINGLMSGISKRMQPQIKSAG